MIWGEFLELKALLMKVVEKFSLNIGKNSNALKEYPRHVVCYTSLVPVLGSITEDNFKDLSYRYIISDRDLELLEAELKDLNDE